MFRKQKSRLKAGYLERVVVHTRRYLTCLHRIYLRFFSYQHHIERNQRCHHGSTDNDR